MPSIADLGVSVSPRDDPLSYPGTAPEHSYLWVDNWIYQLSCAAESAPGDWRLTVDGGPLGRQLRGGAPLSAALRSAGVADMPDRYPVLAYGSNAAPAQLLDKFGRLPAGDRLVPVTIGRAQGFALAFSAHVSNPGYVPYVLVHDDAGHRGQQGGLEVRVLWLAAGQLAVLNETEPNYTLVPVNGARYRLTLESGQLVPRYSAYRGRWGALCWPGQRAVPASTQQSVHGGLARVGWFAQLVGRHGLPEQVQLLRQDSVLRDRVRDGLAANGMAVADGWVD